MTADMTLEQLLEQTIDTLNTAQQRQAHDTDPCHEDFDRWGQVLTTITHILSDVGDTLVTQVSAYERNRVLHDAAGSNPHERLRTACEQLGALTADLKAARHEARDYHATIGHIRAAPEAQPAP